jgi:hypothetical protein
MLQNKLIKVLQILAISISSILAASTLAVSDKQLAQELSMSKAIIAQNPDLNKRMVILGTAGYGFAKKHSHVGNKKYLTLIDFTKPSNEKRLTVIDLDSYKSVLHINVAHGKHSGALYAKHFSNRPGSDETSLGVYVTQNTFIGEHGLSLHIKGIEMGINNNASRRAVEIHCAQYVSKEFIKRHHYAGRSWGCFAVSPVVCHKLAKMLAGGSVIFAYALPEEDDKNLAH